jgi:hypothetical protein
VAVSLLKAKSLFKLSDKQGLEVETQVIDSCDKGRYTEADIVIHQKLVSQKLLGRKSTKDRHAPLSRQLILLMLAFVIEGLPLQKIEGPEERATEN